MHHFLNWLFSNKTFHSNKENSKYMDNIILDWLNYRYWYSICTGKCTFEYNGVTIQLKCSSFMFPTFQLIFNFVCRIWHLQIQFPCTSSFAIIDKPYDPYPLLVNIVLVNCSYLLLMLNANSYIWQLDLTETTVGSRNIGPLGHLPIDSCSKQVLKYWVLW